MQYVHTKYLKLGITDLYRRGGKFQRAARSVSEVLGNITSGIADPFRGYSTTKYREKRLKHCVKYDLAGACRLVTMVNVDIAHYHTIAIALKETIRIKVQNGWELN